MTNHLDPKVAKAVPVMLRGVAKQLKQVNSDGIARLVPAQKNARLQIETGAGGLSTIAFVDMQAGTVFPVNGRNEPMKHRPLGSIFDKDIAKNIGREIHAD